MINFWAFVIIIIAFAAMLVVGYCCAEKEHNADMQYYKDLYEDYKEQNEYLCDRLEDYRKKTQE